MRSVAAISGGVSGLAAAIELSSAGLNKVVLYEKEKCLGGGEFREVINKCGIDIDPNFMVCTAEAYPSMIEFFKGIYISVEEYEMSSSMSLEAGQGYKWGTQNGFLGLFAQKSNTANPYFWQMLREIGKFKGDVLRYLEELDQNPDIPRTESLASFIEAKGYSALFQKSYLVGGFFNLSYAN